MYVLVTGFAPFGGDEENPSWEAARALDGEECQGLPIRALRLPVSWNRAAEVVAGAVTARRPVAVVMAGLAAGRPGVAVERIFVNVRNGRDEDGVQARDLPVIPGGPAAVGSTLDVREIVRQMRGSGIPADLSCTAGTYVCNATAYAVVHGLPHIPAGFVHVPATPALAARRQVRADADGRDVSALASMAPETIRQALRIAAGVAAAAARGALP